MARPNKLETEAIDKLFLELSQFSQAITGRELMLREAIEKALFHLKDATPKDRNGPCIKAIGILNDVLSFNWRELGTKWQDQIS